MELTQIEMKQYVDIINKVAIISKTDLKGNITFVNEIFCQVSKYKKDELIGQPHNILRHPDVSKKIFQQLWDTIQANQPWSGKIKNKAKDGTAYHVNAYIFPVCDENNNIIEYMAVRFLITQEAEEQRKLKTQIRDKLSQEKVKQQELKLQIQELKNTIKRTNDLSDNNQYALEQLEKEREDKKKFLNQIKSYESELSNMTRVTEATVNNSKQKMLSAETQYKSIKDKFILCEQKVDKLEELTKAQNKRIQNYDESLKSQAKTIENLRDVISSLEDDKAKLLLKDQ